MVFLLVFIFCMQNTLLAADAAVIEPIPITDTLGARNRAALEKVKAIVEGRVRFNQSIIKMLKDESVAVEDRISEFCEMQGVSKSDIEELVKKPDESLKVVLDCVNYDLNTLTVAKLICANLERDLIKNGFFLAMHVYATIADLRDSYLRQTKKERQSSLSNKYSELVYYKRIKRCLYKSSLPDFHHQFENMFLCKDGGISFKFIKSRSWKSIPSKHSVISAKLARYREQFKGTGDAVHDEFFNAIEESLSSYVSILGSLEKKVELIKASEQFHNKIVQFEIFHSLKEAFEARLWPYMQAELEIQRLLENMEATEKSLIEFCAAISVLKSLSNKEKHQQDSSSSLASVTNVADQNGKEEKEEEMEEEEEEEDDDDDDDKKTKIHMITLPEPAHARLLKDDASPSLAIFDWISDLKRAKQVDFVDTIKSFQKTLGAEIELSQLTEITFRGPNKKLTTIFCHKPHGAQLKKAWPAWRHSMISGLEAAGFSFKD